MLYVMVTVVIALTMFLALAQSGLFHLWRPTQVYSFVPERDGTSSLWHVADTWQEWTVTFVNRRMLDYKSAPVAIGFELASASGMPSVLDITFPTELTATLPSYYDLWSGWKTVLTSIPVMTVLVDYRAAGSLSSFEPITFSSDDAVGTKRAWTARIVFSGLAEQTQNTLNLQNSLWQDFSFHPSGTQPSLDNLSSLGLLS